MSFFCELRSPDLQVKVKRTNGREALVVIIILNNGCLLLSTKTAKLEVDKSEDSPAGDPQHTLLLQNLDIQTPVSTFGSETYHFSP